MPFIRIQLAERRLFEVTLGIFVGIAAAKFTAIVKVLARSIPMIAKINALFLFMFVTFFSEKIMFEGNKSIVEPILVKYLFR